MDVRSEGGAVAKEVDRGLEVLSYMVLKTVFNMKIFIYVKIIHASIS